MITIIGWPGSALAQDIISMLSAQNQACQLLSPDQFLNNEFAPDSKFIVSVNQNLDLRQAIISKLDSENLNRAKFQHHSAYVDPSAVIGDGSVIFYFSVIGHTGIVEKDCIISPYSMIGHRSTVGQGSLIQPGSLIAGGTKIGKFCVMNFRSSILDKLEICDHTIVGAGALVTKNITTPGHYVGSPARKVS
jgi:UDP-3-O-[3-hydroxymyristoyl] glucosamine N-acyltransferase